MSSRHSQFDLETRPTPTGAAEWTASLSDRWNIGENSNGGYLVATVVAALGTLSEQPDPVTVTTHFLRPGIGNAEGVITGEIVKQGRSMTTVRGRLVQSDKTRVEVLAGFGDLGTGPGERALTVAPIDLPPPEECIPRGDLEQGIDLPILERLDVRIHPDQAHAGTADEAVVSGWIRFADGRAPDARALTLFCDAFPPSVYPFYGSIGWVPTLELTVHIRRRPQPGWIRARFETDDLDGHLFVETGTLWDDSGAVVARSRQLALLQTRE